MENRFSLLGAPGLIAALAALLLALCALACPATAMADEATVVAHSGEGDQRVNYTDVDKALEAGYSGKVIVMDADWIPSKLYPEEGYVTVLVEAGQKVTIDMAGHTIGGGGTAGLCIREGAECTLMSSVKKTISYDGVVDVDGHKTPMQVTTGGLLTSDYDGIAALILNDSAKCTLDGVAVAGSISSGVVMYQDTSLEMKGGATIEHNLADSVQGNPKAGGGICVTGTNASISMTDSSIHHNYGLHGGGVFLESDGAKLTMAGGAVIERNGGSYGGGVYFKSGDSSLTMTDGAAIQYNTAETGGGVCVYHWGYTLKSPDGSGCIKGNSASGTSSNTRSGGGIYLCVDGSKGGLIEGINIADNRSVYDGGGIQVDQPTAIIKDCTITGNSAGRDGGGVYVNNEYAAIKDCTITGNWCATKEGSCEGGGVFVGYRYDLEMSGTCIVKGNTRNEKDSGNADDVFLSTLSGGGGKAYITGTLAEGSAVGVRTGITGDRRIAKSFKPKSKDCLFYDMSGYYVSYGTDEGGDAWQRHTTKEFTVQLDGKTFGKYRNGAAVALSVPATKDGKVFWRWDSKCTTGLNPFSDYFPGNGAFRNAVAFTMPQNDVSLAPIYINRVTAVRFQVEAPEAGRALATTGKLWRSDGGASAGSAPCSVYWYEVDENGNVSDTSATGFAKANTAYKAYLAAPEAGDQGFFYDKEVSAAVSLVSASGDLVKEPKVTDSYLTLSNSLAVHVAPYTTGDGEGAANTGTVKVQLKNKGLLGEGEANAVALMDDGDGDAQADLGDSAQISYAYNKDTDTVTLTAPAREGYNFCNWGDVPSGIEADDEAGTVTASASELKKIETLTAVYAPVATALEVKLDAPVAGDPLAATCADIEATCSDGETVKLAKGFNVDSFEVAWSPEADGNKAGYSTAYTALIKLCDDDGFEDVEKALAAAAKVTCNGTEATAAGFTVKDGKLCLAVTFPATADAKATDITQPADVELTFEQAKACSELGIWPLASSVDVAVESGVAAEGDVDWDAVEGFDANATGAQELTAHGTVTTIVTADGSEIDDSGLSHDVACKIKVAAPAQGGEEGDGQPAAGGADSKSALAKTGDSIPVLAVAAVAAVAVIAIAVAIVAARRRRG